MKPNLVFNVNTLPRTMSRKEWKEAHRWLRIVTKEVMKRVEIDLMIYDVNAPFFLNSSHHPLGEIEPFTFRHSP